MISLSELALDLSKGPYFNSQGRLIALKGAVLIASIPKVAIGDICSISKRDGSSLLASVVGFEKDYCYLAPYDHLDGISADACAKSLQKPLRISLASRLIGKVIDPFGKILSMPNDTGSDAELCSVQISLQNKVSNPLKRKALNQQIETGITAIDLFTPLAFGQRVGLLAGPGLGKSTLLGMICRNSDFDIAVIGLIGERGREISEFVNSCLGPEGLKKSIVVASSSDESCMRRFLAAQTATSIAEYYRDQGKRVLLLIDSLTRAARALRDVSLAAGEMPVRQGFTPSVYSELPRLLERAGNTDKGSITAIYTVLTQNDEANDALGEEIKSILDGHIVLSEKISKLGLRPAIDILKSISRVADNLWTSEDAKIIIEVKSVLNKIINDKEILLLGGQADSELAAALRQEKRLFSLLSQDKNFRVDLKGAKAELREIALLARSAVLS